MSGRHTARFLPRLETLEDRTVPAGILQTKFANHVLTITGVDGATGPLSSQKFALLGAGSGHVSISVQDGETIQGKNSFVSVKKVVLKLNAGDDAVTFVNLRLNKTGNTVDFQGGSGNDSLLFDGTKIDIYNLNVTSGAAATAATDTFTWAPTDPVKSHFVNLTINCPNAKCDLLLGGMGVDKTTKITTSTTQPDVVLMDDNEFNLFTLITGGGSDTVTMGHLDQDDGEDLIFKGYTIFNLGAGDDSLTAGVTVHDPLNGPDEDHDFTIFKGKVVLDGGGDNDTLDVFHPRSTDFEKDDSPIANNWETIIYNP